MSFETVSLLLSWVELGVLLAILFRLGHTFELIANTQRELRRAIHHLGERRAAELANNNAFGKPEIASVSRGWRLPIRRARWMPTIWPACRREIGGRTVMQLLALACGGPDAVWNLQWQTIADARAKDTWEQKACVR
jgi:hypothetical protein